MDCSHESGRKSGGVTRVWAWVVGGAIFVVVLYPLSLGPLEWFHNRGYLNWAEPVFRYYCMPYVWISEHVPLVGEILGWYIDLWRK
jgi:hypothetical protein